MKREPWDELNFTCDYCGARPGQPCRTGGNPYRRVRTRGVKCVPHGSRLRQGNRVWFEHHPERQVAR